MMQLRANGFAHPYGVYLVLVCLALCVCANTGRAQSLNRIERDAWSADTRVAVPRMTTPPTIDGVIHDDEWAQAAEVDSQLSQGGVHNLYPRSVRWLLAWDAQHLYLASRTHLLVNERPKRLARSNVGSAVLTDDTIELWLDPHGRNAGPELASYFQAIINALGTTYFSRLYPAVAARSDDWVPQWTIATHLTDTTMDIEVAMPIASMHLTNPNKAGDTWGMLLARNFMSHTWNQSPIPFPFTNYGFSVRTAYPLMTLQEALPYVKYRSPVALYDGVLVADATIHNPTPAPEEVVVRVSLLDGAGAAPLATAERRCTIPAGEAVPCQMRDAITPPIDVTKNGKYLYRYTVTTAGGDELYHTHFSYNPAENRTLLAATLPPPAPLSAKASFNPVRSMLQTVIDVIDLPERDQCIAGHAVVKDERGTVMAEARTTRRTRHQYVDLVQLPPLLPGSYRWEASVELADGRRIEAAQGSFEKKDEAVAFPWWHADVGNVNKVLWPFKPLTVDHNGCILRAWGKEYQLDGLALPSRIRVTGNTERWPAGRSGKPDVLAAPVSLEAQIRGKALPVRAVPVPTVQSQAAHVVHLAGSGTAGDLQVTTATRLEQDGAYFIELCLAPRAGKSEVDLDRLDLTIPIQAEVATFLNAYAHCGYSGYFIDALPTKPVGTAVKGRVTVWDPTLCGPPSVAVGTFIPQIWLGNEFRGLLWYADNDQGWTPVDGQLAQRIDRHGKTVYLVHQLISVPTVIREPRTIRFVLQPTPIRPLQAGWRMLNTAFAQSFLPWDQMGRSARAYAATVNLTNDAAYEKSRAFAARFPGHRGNPPNLSPYYAPHTESSKVMTNVTADARYFGGEWEGGTYNDSLNDHTLWYLQKWITQGRLQGIYHDQFYPHKITSLSSGLAYLLPDGTIQPGFALTTRRNFVMREHALWLEHGIMPPRTLTHTTNGAPLASLGWVASCVDGEDKLITAAMSSDFADTWPSMRIRAGSIAYNMGATFSWMRLINEKGMMPEQVTAHRRIYIGHCMLHDVMNPFGFDPPARTNALLAWGMNDERVVFWPFWRNSDVVKSSDPEVKVSVWTLPDRLLLCAVNYRKDRPVTCTITVDPRAMGVRLPAKAVVTTVEAGTPLQQEAQRTVTVTLPVGARDYQLVSIGAQP